jgi:hypothetical protein
VQNELDFSADQALFDNLEAATFTSAGAGVGVQPVEVEDATFDFISLKEAAASRGVYQAGDVSFSIRQTLLAGLGGAKPGDTVLRSADGQTYTVLTAVPTVMTRVWDLVCRNLILANNLRQLGTLTRPTNTQDSTGRAALTNYTSVAADVPCRVQPEDETASDVLDRRTMPQQFTAFLLTQVSARAKDRFTCDGVTYTVLGVRNPERIDELMSLTLEKVL